MFTTTSVAVEPIQPAPEDYHQCKECSFGSNIQHFVVCHWWREHARAQVPNHHIDLNPDLETALESVFWRFGNFELFEAFFRWRDVSGSPAKTWTGPGWYEKWKEYDDGDYVIYVRPLDESIKQMDLLADRVKQAREDLATMAAGDVKKDD